MRRSIRALKLQLNSWIIAFDMIPGESRDWWGWTRYVNEVKVGQTRPRWGCLAHALQDAERWFPDLRTWTIRP